MHDVADKLISKVREGVSRQDEVSELLVNDEAAKSDFWYKVRITPWLHVGVILSIFTCNCQLLFRNPILSGNSALTLTMNALKCTTMHSCHRPCQWRSNDRFTWY